MNDTVDEQLLSLTQFALDAANNTYDLDSASKFVGQDFPLRKTSDEIVKAVHQKALDLKLPENDLIKALRNKCGTQNVSNWLKNKVSLSRESAIKVAYALEMTDGEAEDFLGKCMHDGFYMRDIKDVIFRYGLNKELDFVEVEEMIKDYTFITYYSAIKIAYALMMVDDEIEQVLWRCWHGGFCARDMRDIINQFNVDKALDFTEVEKAIKNFSFAAWDLKPQTAFALMMMAGASIQLFERCWRDGFFLGDIKDAIKQFCLKKGAPYAEVEKMIMDYTDPDAYNPDPDLTDIGHYGRLTAFLSGHYDRSVYTPGTLDGFLRQNRNFFGSFRRKAYESFMYMYKQWKKNEDYQVTVDHEYAREAAIDNSIGIIDRLVLPKDYKYVYIQEGESESSAEKVSGKVLSKDDLVTLENTIAWLTGPKALIPEGLTDERRVELEKGVNLLFDPKAYDIGAKEKRRIRELGGIVAEFLDPSITGRRPQTESELKELKEELHRILSPTHYARNASTTEDLCELLQIGVLPKIVKEIKKLDNAVLTEIAKNEVFDSAISEIKEKSLIVRIDRDKGKNKKLYKLGSHKITMTQASRAYLLRMWLLLNGANPDYHDPAVLDDYYEEAIENINFRLLEPCGIPKLDSRNPFDWIIMNSLRYNYSPDRLDSEDEDVETMERIRLLVKTLFENDN